jgi:Zn finger protein HypA/HybF involved in hydrogenase expression
MADNTFHCIKCGKNREAKRMGTTTRGGKAAGVSMSYYTAICPKCGSKMMKIRGISGVSRSHRRF